LVDLSNSAAANGKVNGRGNFGLRIGILPPAMMLTAGVRRSEFRGSEIRILTPDFSILNSKKILLSRNPIQTINNLTRPRPVMDLLLPPNALCSHAA
jgi:hypothetical protein